MRPIVPFAVLFVALSASAGPTLRDSRTGLALKGSVRGRIAQAAGHRSMQADVDANIETTIWLDPVEVPEELRPESIQEQMRPGTLLVYGHAVDADSGAPLANVALRMSGVSAFSDDNGWFSFHANAKPAADESAQLAATDDLTATVDGYADYKYRNIYLREGDLHLIVEMKRGTGTTEHDGTHALLLQHESEAPGTSTVHSDALPGPISSELVSAPASIRVGFNCPTSTTCTSVQVYSLETYVAGGVDDEWYPSWTADSLKAGTVAYRSYAAWYVLNPKTASYDICNTTSCQVFNPATTTTSVQSAAAATAGVIILDSTGTRPFLAEYAAEQNHSSTCGDGSTGQPSSNWACIADTVCAGAVFNGHGRGMCQWGSQRWSFNQGKDWQWILNHYYNNNGVPAGARNGLLPIATAAARTRGDFDGDRKADLLWRNGSTGNDLIWFMNGASVARGSATFAATAGYTPFPGDFNGDGKADIVWYNGSTTNFWLLNGTPTSTAQSVYMTMATPWQIFSTADFDGDGRDDVLWRNMSTGNCLIWFMSGTTVVRGSATFPVSLGFMPYIGDFNGDGKADLVWYDGATTNFWILNGTPTPAAQSAFLSMAAPWQIQGIGDFDADGKSDVLWRNTSTGACLIWFMNGTTVARGSATFSASLGYVAHVADFNGDAKADIAWFNGTTTNVWLLNGSGTPVSQTTYVSMAAPWDVLGPR